MLISEVRRSQGRPTTLAYGRETQSGRRQKKKVRHPLIARPKAMLGIVVHAVRHPLQPAIIDLDTGDVTPIRE